MKLHLHFIKKIKTLIVIFLVTGLNSQATSADPWSDGYEYGRIDGYIDGRAEVCPPVHCPEDYSKIIPASIQECFNDITACSQRYGITGINNGINQYLTEQNYLCSESYTEFPVFTNDSDNTFFDGNILYFNAMHLAGSVFNIKFCYIPLGSHDFYFKLIDLHTTQ
ncbi:hypothetical protein [Candidatus Venteria ishoeyi]|uniref:Secreted protein n=1 Tax=Candidatus Venteria ishoeyi TaxID=1899563 RepID=A0A1H6F403_9GAMM|nr:hypothetical protein [Candidatus Venteria ishoeyi]SEH04877.1 Uncharacterised protein [Candidatus Venteria ishoeyi]